MCQKYKGEEGEYIGGKKNTKRNDTKNLQGFLCKNMLYIVNGSGGIPGLTWNKLAQASEQHSRDHMNQSTA